MLLVLPLTGCEDFLDAENLTNAGQNADQFLSQDPSAMRATAYNDFRTIVNNISFQDEGSDLFINPRGADDGKYSMYTITPIDGDVQNWYKNLYNAINHANGLIKYAGTEAKYEAEGKFLRCWGYYLLTQHFGAVPYVTEFIESANRDYPRVEVSEIYPALIAELTELYNGSALPATNHNGEISKQAVAALAAKVALAAGWDLGTTLNDEKLGTYSVNNKEYFTQAASWAEKAINGIELTMSFEDKWSPFKEGNNEEIFSIQYDRAGYPGNEADGGHSLMYNYMGYYGNCVDIGQKGTASGGTDCHSVKSLQMWEKGDSRFYGTFMTTCYNSDKSSGTPVWGTQGYLAYFNCSPAELAKLKIAYIFYPPYMTTSEVQADLKSKASQTVKDATQGIVTPFAVHYGLDQVTRWTFNEDGSFTKDSKADKEPLAYMRNNASGNGMCVKKFDDPQSACVTKNNCYRDIVVFHVSDMYLIAAEAYMMAGDDGKALQKINAVRQRAGAPTLASFDAYEIPYVTSTSFIPAKIDLILDERARELYAERTRWEDLRRTRQLVRYNVEFARSISAPADMQNPQGETKWYRPIPQTEINNNSAMTNEVQNPGY